MDKTTSHSRWFWFFGGLGAGITAISFSQASVPKKGDAGLLREMKTSKISAPDLEGDFSSLSLNEKSFSESAEQQRKLKQTVIGETVPPAPRKRGIR
ncbi:MAG: hypothetical protein EBX52_02280 [Proteobacteria bacterium]|nr:hypothetical protein [Pseudomonadota bacterium]